MSRKLIATSTHSGSDSLKFYDLGVEHIGVVHFDLWEDIDSSAVAEYGKYNVQAGTVCIRGFESYGSKDPLFIGQSVHDALRSCGFKLDADFDIIEEHSEAIFAIGPRPALDNGGFKPGKAWILTVVECMWGYGAKEVNFDGSGNNRAKLERKGRNSL